MKKTTIICALGLAVAALVALNAGAGDHAYVGAEQCKMCHKVQYGSWLETTHAKATEHDRIHLNALLCWRLYCRIESQVRFSYEFTEARNPKSEILNKYEIQNLNDKNEFWILVFRS